LTNIFVLFASYLTYCTQTQRNIHFLALPVKIGTHTVAYFNWNMSER
jgi:hypothetical protein